MMSFESAVYRLGGNAMRLDVKRSSVQKGESLEGLCLFIHILLKIPKKRTFRLWSDVDYILRRLNSNFY